MVLNEEFVQGTIEILCDQDSSQKQQLLNSTTTNKKGAQLKPECDLLNDYADVLLEGMTTRDKTASDGH